ncbi:MAG: flagellar hook capping FlgD N-terminal domain-containing protein [Micropepsaceae bacterium]
MDVNATSAASSQAQKSNKVLTQNFDTFLKLLTAQLQNQDPLEPMDAAQFTQQLVQYSSVEQGIYTNKNLETLIAMQQTAGLGSAVNYIGREVMAENPQALLADGQATWTYTLPTAATSVSLAVRDANGKVVYSGTGPVTAGEHTIGWDGKLASGADAPAGVYKLEITAKAADNSAIAAPITLQGRVTGVQMINGAVVLNLGGIKLNLTDVQAVREAVVATDA